MKPSKSKTKAEKPELKVVVHDNPIPPAVPRPERKGVVDLEEVRRARAAARRNRRWSDCSYAIKLRQRIMRMTTHLMNKEHAVVQFGNDVIIATTQRGPTGGLEMLYRKPEAVKLWYSNVEVKLPKITSGGKVSAVPEIKNPVDIWLRHKNRRSIRGIKNMPGVRLSPEWINLWTEWGTEPLRKDDGSIDYSGERCALIRRHVREVLCNGDERGADWLEAWWAHILQHPTSKQPTGVLIYGAQGAGKSIITEKVLGKIIGSTAYSAERDTKFLREDAGNTIVAGKLLIVAEEAIFSGDPRAAALLKTFISQETINIRYLFKDSLKIDNHARVMAFLNPQASGGHALHVENDDRRWAIFECSSHRVNDYAYFDALLKEIENGGVEAYHAYLLDPKRLNGIELRKGYETQATLEQKVYSLPHQEAFIYECLRAGTVHLNLSGEAAKPWADEGEKVIDKEFFRSYLAWCRENRRDYTGTVNAFNKKLRACLGDPAKGRDSKGNYYWKLGSLETCRKAFEKWIRCPDEQAWREKLWGLDELEKQPAEELDEHEAMWATMPTEDEVLDDTIPY